MINAVLNRRLTGAGHPSSFPKVVEDAGGDGGSWLLAIGRWQLCQCEESEQDVSKNLVHFLQVLFFPKVKGWTNLRLFNGLPLQVF